jgi:hypothetical protein
MCYQLVMHSVLPPFRKFARFHFHHISFDGLKGFCMCL